MQVIKYRQTNHQKHRFAIVVSEFNRCITARLQDACVNHLIAAAVPANQIQVIEVPGAVEIPLILKRLAQSKQFDALIALGCVIRGDTSHYDYVCEQVSQGCQQVSLDAELPVIFGILTTENEEQALARVGGKHGHKGVDAAQAALAMVDIMEQIQV